MSIEEQATVVRTICCDAPGCGAEEQGAANETAASVRARLKEHGWRYTSMSDHGTHAHDLCPLHARDRNDSRRRARAAEREQEVFRRAESGESYATIAASLGISKARVAQLYSMALRRRPEPPLPLGPDILARGSILPDGVGQD